MPLPLRKSFPEHSFVVRQTAEAGEDTGSFMTTAKADSIVKQLTVPKLPSSDGDYVRYWPSRDPAKALKTFVMKVNGTKVFGTT